MRQHILDYLKMTPERYESMILDTYISWVSVRSFDNKEAQQLLANTQLFNWWYTTFMQLEDDFVTDIEFYKGVININSLRLQYLKYTSKIMKRYSKKLQKQAINLNISSYENN